MVALFRKFKDPKSLMGPPTRIDEIFG